MWYPRKDGDYSSWSPIFDKKIKQYCKKPKSFENGMSVFGEGASRSLFKTFRSQAGLNSLTRAVEEKSFGSYIRTKSGSIAFMTISFIVFVLSIFLAFSLMKCFRNRFLKCNGACTDRRRYPPHQLKGKKPTIFKWISATILLGMTALAIVFFVYSAYLSYGKNSLACDFWTTMRGYYFGATDLRASPDVAIDWKGSHPQWVAMNELKDIVNPHPDERQPGPPVCRICKDILQIFNGTENSFVAKLSASRDQVMIYSLYGAVLIEAIGQYIQKFPWLDLNTDDINVSWNHGSNLPSSHGPMRLQFGNILPALLWKYAQQLDETTNDGISLFMNNLNFYLGRNSLMLKSSFETAKNSVISLIDVDWVTAKILLRWDSSLWPTVSTLLTVVIVISSILGILAVFFATGGTAVFFKLHKYSRSELIPPAKLTTCLGVVYVILLVLSGFSFFMSSILFFAGSAGSDICGFVDQVTFEDGNWNVFPPDLLNETATGKTDIPTVLDTCVKRSGDGDVAASLGIRISLDKLSQDVATTEASLLANVEEILDLRFKSFKTNSLANMVKSVGVSVHGDRPFMSVSTTYHPSRAIKEEFVITGADQVFPWIGVPDVAHLTAMDGISSLLRGNPQYINLLSYVDFWLRDLFPNAVASEKAWKVLNDLASEAFKTNKTTFNHICSPYLIDKVCSGATAAGKKVYLLKGKPSDADIRSIGRGTITLKPAHNPFEDKNYIDFLKVFQGDPKKLLTAIQLTATLMQNDWMVQVPISAVIGKKSKYVTTFNDDSKAQELISRLGGDSIYIEKVIEEFLPTLWDRKLGVAKSNISTLPELLNVFNKYNGELSQHLLDGFSFANNAILNFVQNTTIGCFKSLLTNADENLENFNCQFVGTSLEHGVVADMCDVIMPSVVALGLSGIFLWIFSGLGAYIIWKIYHFYLDLETLGKAVDGDECQINQTISTR